jgi:hypothetical protein
MSRTSVVRRRTTSELMSQPVVRWSGAALFALAIAAVLLVAFRWQAQTDLVNALIAVVGLIPPFLATLLFVGGPLTRDLVNGTVTSLMATPTSPTELTRGTTLALVQLTWPLTLLTPIALAVAHGGLGATPPPLTVVALVLTPALGWGTAWLTVALAFTRGVETALAATWMVGLLAIVVVPGGVLLGWFDVTSWAFTAAYAVLVSQVWLAVWALDATATRPRLAEAR